MTACEVLDGMKARLSAGVHPGERWTSWPELTMDSIIMHRVYDDQRRCVAECSSPDVAEVLAAAPTDVARLAGAVEALLTLADQWNARGEHDMAYSKTIPDEDIAIAILTDGAAKVENARHIRNAVENALKE